MNANTAIPNIALNNGVDMPLLGYGVFQVEPAKAEACVANALEAGYRMIDTAQAYGNEEGVGKALASSGLAREDIFVVTKMWVSNFKGAEAAASIDASLERLGLDYVDLMLIHQPYSDYYNGYRALEQAYAEGKIRAIGVSNFSPSRLMDIAAFADVVPAVNQIETHAFWQQRPAREVMDRLGVAHMSWGPLAEGANGFFANPVLAAAGAKHGKTAAQAGLRYLVQRGVVAIPKSVRRERMEENLAIFDFELDAEDLAAIGTLDANKPLIANHEDPDFNEWFIEAISSGQW